MKSNHEQAVSRLSTDFPNQTLFTKFQNLHLTLDGARDANGNHINYPKHFVRGSLENPFSKWRIVSLAAERDIKPEPMINGDDLEPSGHFATNLIRRILTWHKHPRHLVTDTLRKGLNAIFQQEAVFRGVHIVEIEDSQYEIRLDEQGRGEYPLSQSGSGLKTVILVLLMLDVLPQLLPVKRPLNRTIFTIEEPENNLHAAVQRRLLEHVHSVSQKTGCRTIITTHSNVLMDMASRLPDTSILHVTGSAKSASVRPISFFGDHCGVLDDLDIRASDLFQSNGVIWVEDPSDRIYIRRWISLWSDNSLTEHQHYVCVWYGGSVGSHLDFQDPTTISDRVHALKINRNAAILVDSDRLSERDDLKPLAERLVKEVQEFGGVAHITNGRTVENYLPSKVLRDLFPFPATWALKRHADAIKAVRQHRRSITKVELANAAVGKLTIDDVKSNPHLAAFVNDLCEAITKWNRMPPPVETVSRKNEV